jgi:hypothetical protein
MITSVVVSVSTGLPQIRSRSRAAAHEVARPGAPAVSSARRLRRAYAP